MPRQPIADQIWDMKYRFKTNAGEPIDITVEDTWKRVATALANAEQNPIDWVDPFCEALEDFKFLPAGRIVAGAGTGRLVTLFNCYVMGTIPDSIRGIYAALQDAALTMQQGGGIGYDFSTIRPKGAEVKGVAADASGPLSFMDCWNSMCKTIMSAGSRRGAMMATLRCDHPDIEAFIEAKADPTRLRMFNMSVLVTDDFMAAVKADTDWRLHFEDKHGNTLLEKTVRAVDLWNKIMQSTYDQAEPGVIIIDRINAANNLNYCETISSTNPCFSGNQTILTDQGPKTFFELEGQRVSVLTENHVGKLVYRPMAVFKTAENQEVIRVILDDGTTIDCTPNHEFFDLGRNRIAAQDLSPGQRLASVYRHNANSKGYKRLTNGIDNPLEHHVPFEVIPDGFHVHHKNEVKDDNRPQNLELIHGSEHNSYHMQGDRNPAITHPENNKLIQMDHSGENNGRYRSDISDDSIQEMRKQGMSYKDIASAIGCSKYTVMKRLGYERPNHKVVSVSRLSERQDVFCGTVEETHKFFLGCERGGVLVSNCGEQPLPPYGACLLGSMNLTRFILNPFTKDAAFDYDSFDKYVRIAIRMMDNVVDVSNFPLPEQEAEAKAKRRLGLGITGLADALLMMWMTYGEDDAVRFTEKISKKLFEAAYDASCDLAEEKGSFPMFDAEKFLAPGTAASKLPKAIQDRIRKTGIRNSHTTSIAPTGTISLYAGNVSSGIEPVFAYEYTRKVLQKDGTKTEELVQDYAVDAFWEFMGEHGSQHPGDLPDHFVSAQTLAPLAHVRMQAAAQKWVDSSISKTINCPEDISFEDFKDVYMAAWNMGCKGCTTYRPNEVTGSILSVEPPKPALPTPPVEVAPPKRPERLFGSTYKIKWAGVAFYINITDYEDPETGIIRPFEVFINSKNMEHFSWIVGLTRMISAIFRRPHDSRFVVEELKSVFDPKGGAWMDGKYIPSILAAIGGVIEQHMRSIGYIKQEVPQLVPAPEGVMVVVESGHHHAGPSCHKCNSFNVKKESGCFVCKDCGESTCG